MTITDINVYYGKKFQGRRKVKKSAEVFFYTPLTF